MIEKKIVLMYGEQTVQKSYRIPKSKFKEIDEAIKELLSKYEDPKTVVVFCKSKTKVTGEVQDMKPIIDLEIKNKAPEWATKYKEVLRPTSEISNSEEVDLSKANEPISIKEMPRDKKPYSLIRGDYDGLYSSKGKWYTNKVINNMTIVILEWINLDSAKNYLDSLKK